MAKTQQVRLLQGGVQSVDEKQTALLKRLGIESLPPHETKLIAIDKIIVSGEASIARPSKKLVKSIQHVGILQAPSLVPCHPVGLGMSEEETVYEVIMGRRRVLAARLVGVPVVKCEVYAYSTPQLGSLLALIENAQRSSAWVKEVEDLRRLISGHVGMTVDDLVDFGFERVSLSVYLKIARLPEPLFDQVTTGQVSYEVAKRLTRLTESQRARIIGHVLDGEDITPGLVTSVLRAQINAGLAPVQVALAQAWTSSPVPDAGAFTTDGHYRVATPEGWSDGVPSLAQVLAMLHAFEQSGQCQDSSIQSLIKVLIQKLHITQRDQQPRYTATL